MLRALGIRVLIMAGAPLFVAAVLYLVSGEAHAAAIPLAISAVVGAVASLFGPWPLVCRLERLRAVARRAAAGELDAPFDGGGADDLLADVESDLESFRRAMQLRVREGDEARGEQRRRMEDVNRGLGELRGAVEGQLKAVEESAGRLREMTATLQQIAQSVETLASAAEESSSSILEMATANDEVSENMLNLAASVQESASSIEEMTFSIK